MEADRVTPKQINFIYKSSCSQRQKTEDYTPHGNTGSKLKNMFGTKQTQNCVTLFYTSYKNVSQIFFKSQLSSLIIE